VDDAVALEVRVACESDTPLTETHVSYSLLRQEFKFVGVQSDAVDPQTLFPRGATLLVLGSRVCDLVEQFQFLTTAHLRLLARTHGLQFTSRYRRNALSDLLRLHRQCSCHNMVLLFRRIMHICPNERVVHLVPPLGPDRVAELERGHCLQLQQRRRQEETAEDTDRRRARNIAQQQQRRQWDACDTSNSQPPDEFLVLKMFEQKKEIIREWQETMDPRRFVETACAVCAWGYPSFELEEIQPSVPILRVLQNDCLPSQLLPTVYDNTLYRKAILCPEGMTATTTLAPLRICLHCRHALHVNSPRQPKYALANFLYYGAERLPEDVSLAF